MIKNQLILTIAVVGFSQLSMAKNLPEMTAKQKLTKLEQSFNGTIGVYALDTSNNNTIEFNANKRFPTQSTMKLIIAGAVFKKSTTNPELLQEKITYTKLDSHWSPIAKKYLNIGMTLESMLEATATYSDNTCANLILKKFGGPKFATDFAHSIGNNSFNINHYEGNLNSDPKSQDDTSTPKDMAISMQKLLLGNAITQQQQKQLLRWMVDNTTSYQRIRAATPTGFTLADKTGSGDYGVTNDIGIMWSPWCKPIVLSIYTIQNNKNAKHRDDILASTTQIILTEFAKNNSCFANP